MHEITGSSLSTRNSYCTINTGVCWKYSECNCNRNVFHNSSFQYPFLHNTHHTNVVVSFLPFQIVLSSHLYLSQSIGGTVPTLCCYKASSLTLFTVFCLNIVYSA